MMKYPDKFIRGISAENYVDKAGRASAAIFQFLSSPRDDGYSESSINWYDDDDALSFTMEQRKKDDKTQYQFKVGAAIIEKSEADKIIANPLYNGIFAYERSPTYANKYHGNLLRKDKDIIRGTQIVISAYLAMNAQIKYRKTI